MPRRAGLDRASVVAAAVTLVNREGMAALSLKRLADTLSVQTPSLYNHVDGLPGLERELTLLSIRQLGDALAAAAIGKSGATAVAALLDAYRAFINANPGLVSYTVRPAAPEDTERVKAEVHIVHVAMAIVASFGLAGDDAIHAVRALRSAVHGFATLETAGGFGIPLDLDESFRRLVATVVAGLEQQAAGAGG
jgi:AcrR family transcriptional regulator